MFSISGYNVSEQRHTSPNLLQVPPSSRRQSVTSETETESETDLTNKSVKPKKKKKKKPKKPKPIKR